MSPKSLLAGLLALTAVSSQAVAQQEPNRMNTAEPTVAVWARNAVERLRSERILAGSGAGPYHGEQSVTRYQATYALIRLWERWDFPSVTEHPDHAVEFLLTNFSPTALPVKSHGEKPDYLKDVPPHSWGNEYTFPILLNSGFVRGYPDGYFKGKRPLKRAELAVLMCRFLRCVKHVPTLNLDGADFRDVAGDEWWFGAVLTAAGSGLMSGYPDHTFRPDQAVTRNELAVTLERLTHLAEPSTH